jgi:hypothetical protein
VEAVGVGTKTPPSEMIYVCGSGSAQWRPGNDTSSGNEIEQGSFPSMRCNGGDTMRMPRYGCQAAQEVEGSSVGSAKQEAGWTHSPRSADGEYI